VEADMKNLQDLILLVEKSLKEKNMNKNQLSIKANIPSSTITAFMKGKIKNPTTDLISKIAYGLDKSISELIEDVEILDELNNTQNHSSGAYLYQLRGNMSYEEFSKYIEEIGGMHIKPTLLKQYEKGEHHISEVTLNYLVNIVNGDTTNKNVYLQKLVDLYFMDNEIIDWLKNPYNYDLIKLTFNTSTLINKKSSQ
jgi:transcriptional regulator with XRE-family HTH domain